MPTPTPTQSSRRVILIAAVTVSIALVGLLAPMPFKSRAGDRLADFLHLPVFAILTSIALTLSDRFVSTAIFTRLLTTLFVVFLSACIELLQSRLGRTASLQDLIANGSGAAAACLVHQSFGSGRMAKVGLRLLAIALVVTVSLGPLRMLLNVWQQQQTPGALGLFLTNAELGPLAPGNDQRDTPFVAAAFRRCETSATLDSSCPLSRIHGPRS